MPRIADVVSFGGAGEALRDPARPRPAQAVRHHASSSSKRHRPEQRQRRRRLPAAGRHRAGGARAGADRRRARPHAASSSAGMRSQGGQRLFRGEEDRRLREIRQIVLTATNNVPIRVGDVVEGGRHAAIDAGRPPRRGRGQPHPQRPRGGQRAASTTSRATRSSTRRADASGTTTKTSSQGIVLLRKGEKSLPALADVKAKVEQLNERPASCCRASSWTRSTTARKLIELTTTHGARERAGGHRRWS